MSVEGSKKIDGIFMSGDTPEELMALGEAILSEAHTRSICEREERMIRDETIAEADRSFDEDLGLLKATLADTSDEVEEKAWEELGSKMKAGDPDMDDSIRNKLCDIMGFGDVMSGEDAMIIDLIANVMAGDCVAYEVLKRGYIDGTTVHETIHHSGPAVVINVQGDYHG